MFASHTRSGLHMLRLSLRALTLQPGESLKDLNYEDFWGNVTPWGKKYPYFHSINGKYSAALDVPNVKYLFLIRNYHDLLDRSYAPWILRTYASINPEALLEIDPNIDLDRVTNLSLSDRERFGTFAFDFQTYIKFVHAYETLPKNISKKIIYFEDLKANPTETILQVADFLEIEYSENDFDFENISEFIKKMYIESKHIPTPPGCRGSLSEPNHTFMDKAFIDGLGPELADKYLKNYIGEYKYHDESLVYNREMV